MLPPLHTLWILGLGWMLAFGAAPARAADANLRAQAETCAAESVDQAERVLAAAERGLAQAERRSDVAARILFHYCRAGALELLRGERAGLPDYAQGIALAARHGLPDLQGRGLHSRATTQSLLGEQAQALIDLLAAQKVYEDARMEHAAERNLVGIAAAYRRMGELDTALRYLEDSRARAVRSGDEWLLHQALLQLGYLHYDRGEHTQAVRVLEAALRLKDVQASPYYRAVTRAAIAASEIRLERPAQALQLLQRAAGELAEVDGDAGARILLELRRGEALAALGRHAAALPRYEEALARLDQHDNLRYRALAYELRAASHRALNDSRTALLDYMRYSEARAELERLTRQQQDALLRHRFDAHRREIENRRLARETALRREQLQSLQATRRWQRVALASSLSLLLLLTALGTRQLLRGRRLQRLAMTDALTGAGNRRSFEAAAAMAMTEAQREGRPLSVLAIDIDHFKQVNDRHGHAVGDAVLRGVARVCQQVLREQDRFARVGGEEFVALLPHTDAAEAAKVAERVRSAVEGARFDGAEAGLAVTVSVGHALAARAESVDALLERADAALYRAKAGGRNRVVGA